MITSYCSKWGIKHSRFDITQDILNLAINAKDFIIIGGYNFSYKNAGYNFFNILAQKVSQQVPVLIILPHNLMVKSRQHTSIINHCIQNGIGLIFNSYNHSKWMVTEKGIYYGSSNFSPTSWYNRVEVVSFSDITCYINNNRNRPNWALRTLFDFINFVANEMSLIARRPTMSIHINHTIQTWNNIISNLLLRYNPSIEKVKQTLENFPEVELKLKSVIDESFLVYNEYLYKKVFEFSRDIFLKTERLCEYAYFNIYNEFKINETEEALQKYNKYYDELASEVKNKISSLQKYYEENPKIEPDINLIKKNEEIIQHIENKIQKRKNELKKEFNYLLNEKYRKKPE